MYLRYLFKPTLGIEWLFLFNISKSGKLRPFFHKNPLHVSKNIFFLRKKNSKNIPPKQTKKTFFTKGQNYYAIFSLLIGFLWLFFNLMFLFSHVFFISSCVFVYQTFLARLIASIIFIYIVVPKIGFVGVSNNCFNY